MKIACCSIAALLTLAPTAALGSEETFAGWISAKVVAQPESPLGEVTVRAEIDGRGPAARIRNLRSTEGGRELKVPEEAFRELRHPRLDTLRISSEAGLGGPPWLYVSLELGRLSPEGEWDFPRIYFAFRDGEFVKRFTARRRPDGGRSFTDDWYPPEQTDRNE